jgi:hypothetical protein
MLVRNPTDVDGVAHSPFLLLPETDKWTTDIYMQKFTASEFENKMPRPLLLNG